MIQVEGNIVDIWNRKIFPGTIFIEDNKIVSIKENSNVYHCYIAPGFIDAHVHIESSMLVPEEFSKLAIQKGTVAVVNDPHEIANVLGKEGINFMIENSKKSLIKLFFTIPSCVPSTPFDSSGSQILSSDVKDLLETHIFVGLSEMMNVPGVLSGDPEVWCKINLTKNKCLVIDGHAPGLIGKDLVKYVESGISTDHECTYLEEALQKIHLGMKILIREGSAAKNYFSLRSLIDRYPDQVMFCTDDSHPGDLLKGHIDKIVKKAIKDGFDLFNVLKIASINPVLHYGLNVGTLREGENADFIIFDNLQEFNISSVFVEGKERFNKEYSLISSTLPVGYSDLNKFEREFIKRSDISKFVGPEIPCIKVIDNEILTKKVVFSNNFFHRNFESDIDRDILKIVYLNRYENKPPQVAFIQGIGLKYGAFATSISHDSHNIIAVGCNDNELTLAINRVIAEKGGLVIVNGEKDISLLPLPLAGIMTFQNGQEVAQKWEDLIHKLKEMGCNLTSPFMTLSFMALIVIPELKIGENGLFEFSRFAFIE